MSLQTIDQLGRTINISHPPQKIVSLVPSITELIYDLGLGKQLVGRTKFCVHPKIELKSITNIGGTKTINLERIAALEPDLIIANKEENQQEQIEQLIEAGYPVWVSAMDNFSDSLMMITALGRVVGKPEKAKQIVMDSQRLMDTFKTSCIQKVAYLIWRDPYMTIGNDTYIHDMLARLGYKNVYGDQTRYPIFTLEELKKRAPEIIFLSSEPFPFKEKHISELQEVFPNTRILLVDGEAFSWYGTRFLKTYEYLQQL